MAVYVTGLWRNVSGRGLPKPPPAKPTAGPAGSDGEPTTVPVKFDHHSSIAVGSGHTCWLRTDGSVTCWGTNYLGESEPPTGRFISVASGRSHSCGVRTDGTMTCWGHNGDGQADAPEGTFGVVSAGVAAFVWGAYRRHYDLLGPQRRRAG